MKICDDCVVGGRMEGGGRSIVMYGEGGTEWWRNSGKEGDDRCVVGCRWEVLWGEGRRKTECLSVVSVEVVGDVV